MIYKKERINMNLQTNFLLTLLILLPISDAFNLEILDPDVVEEMVFVDGELTDYYNSTIYQRKFDCTNGQLQIIQFEESPQDERITFRYSGAEIQSVDRIKISVEPNVAPKPFIKEFDKKRKKIVIDAGCPDPIEKNNYFNRVVVKIIALQKNYDTNQMDKNKKNYDDKPRGKQHRYMLQKQGLATEVEKEYVFSFLLNCDLYDLHKNFEYGYIFLSIIGLFVVVVISMHPRIYSLRINNVPISVQIKWHGFLALAIVTLLCMLAIYGQHLSPKEIKINFGNRSENQIRFQLANTFIKHLGLLAAFFYVFVCLCEAFFQWQFLLNWVPFLQIRIGTLVFSKRAFISAILAFLCFLLGLYSNNWLYYNFLSCCISVGAIKMFKFRSLRNAAYTMLIVICTIIAITIWSNYKLSRSVNDYASELSSPLVLEVPDLVNNLYKKCSWISVFDLVLPGAILAYLRDYDENYHVGWKGVYTFTGIISYFFSCFCWVIIEALTTYNVPFCIVDYPLFIGSIVLSSIRRNQFQTLWDGYFHFSMDLTALQLIEQYRSDHSVDLSKIFPKEIMEAIINQQSKWSSSDSHSRSKHNRSLVLENRLSRRFDENNLSFLRSPKRKNSSVGFGSQIGADRDSGGKDDDHDSRSAVHEGPVYHLIRDSDDSSSSSRGNHNSSGKRGSRSFDQGYEPRSEQSLYDKFKKKKE